MKEMNELKNLLTSLVSELKPAPAEPVESKLTDIEAAIKTGAGEL